MILRRIKQNNKKNSQRGGCNPLIPSPVSASALTEFYLSSSPKKDMHINEG